jgi:hypothetical protein
MRMDTVGMMQEIVANPAGAAAEWVRLARNVKADAVELVNRFVRETGDVEDPVACRALAAWVDEVSRLARPN